MTGECARLRYYGGGRCIRVSGVTHLLGVVWFAACALLLCAAAAAAADDDDNDAFAR